MDTYALIGERTADEKATIPLRDDHSNFKLQFDLERMTDYERDVVEEKLTRALDAIRASKN